MLTPQIIDEALVDTATRVRYVRRSRSAADLIRHLFRSNRSTLSCVLSPATSEHPSTSRRLTAGAMVTSWHPPGAVASLAGAGKVRGC